MNRKPDPEKAAEELMQLNHRHPGLLPQVASFQRIRILMICLVLVLSTGFIYWPVANHSFLNYDDQEYVTENPHVRTGLILENLIWAFHAIHSANWHPITWISHMVDVQLFGIDPGMHHLSSLFLHALNSILLVHVLNKMTGNFQASFLAAALFALHPLQVESVAWIAERKNVLSAFFGILTIRAYVCYAQSPRLNRYLQMVFFFMLSLMAKPMLVTMPFLLLLIDYWPLKRLSNRFSFYRSLREKVPLVFLASLSCLITVIAQKDVGAIKQMEAFPLSIRVANALMSYISYMAKTIWPRNLAAFYPHPGGSLPLWKVSWALLILILISVWVGRYREKHPHLLMGWLWYLGTLVPVLGLIQVGSQALADRYAYIPLIGLFIMIAWTIPFQRLRPVVLYPIAGIVFFLLMTGTRDQVRHWRNDAVLYAQMLDVTTDNFQGHFGMGLAFANKGMLDEAIDHYQTAIRLKPNYDRLYNNLGIVFLKQGKLQEASSAFQKATQLNCQNAKAYNNLGVALISAGRRREAIRHFKKAIAINPNYEEAKQNLMNAGGDFGILK
jgi:hypothetical protein